MTRASPIVLALLLPATAAAMPPPVEVAPLVLSAPAESKNRAELVELIEMMGKEGHFTVQNIAQDSQALDPCWKARRSDRHCLAKLAPAWPEGVPRVAVVIDSPEWQMAAVRVRCIGPDVARARIIDLYLSDARSGHPNALQEKAKLAGCMIGAIYGSPAERG